MPRVVVSFKNTKEELDLYDEICKASDRSAYVKDILKAYKRMTEESKPATETVIVKRIVRLKKGTSTLTDQSTGDSSNETLPPENKTVETNTEQTVETPKPTEVVKEAAPVEEVIENKQTEEIKTDNSTKDRRRGRSGRLMSYDY